VGERKRPFFEPTFNRSVKVQEGTDRLTSDAGFLLARKADHRLGLTESLAADLRDPRQQYLIRYTMSELLRERIYSMMLGYRAQDDVDRLAHDPALRIATWNRLRERVVAERSASQSTHSRLINIVAEGPGNLESVRGGQFLGGGRLRQYAGRAPLGERLRPRDPPSRQRPHCGRKPAFAGPRAGVGSAAGL
jgi:hypothetical protein